jgi:hypothetical protein
MKFGEFLNVFCGTVLGDHVDEGKAREEDRFRAVCATADAKLVAVKAVVCGATTPVQFNPPGMEMLAVVDDIIRKLV